MKGTVKFCENEGTIVLIKEDGWGFIELRPVHTEEGLESFYFGKYGDNARAYRIVECINGLRLISKPTPFSCALQQMRTFAVYDVVLSIKLLEIEAKYYE